ncbi:MAG: DUF2927 domain-containing protein [Nioella sp.]
MTLPCDKARTGAMTCFMRALGVILSVGLLPVQGMAQQARDLTQYYQRMEAQLISQGHLRQERRVPGLDAQTLARNFMSIAMRTEYSPTGNGAASGYSPLRRWEDPVRLGVHFGPSVSATQQRHDLAAVRGVSQRLQRATGHPIRMVNSGANFHVLVLSEAERANVRNTLLQIAPGLSRAAQSAVMRMRPDTLCLVMAIPHDNPEDGFRQAIAIVRAEHPSRMRQSCMEEELAQGMGLTNDSPEARPSIFNDDEEFGVLTRHDELLLRMLYHDALRCGMSPRDVVPRVEALAHSVLSTG